MTVTVKRWIKTALNKQITLTLNGQMTYTSFFLKFLSDTFSIDFTDVELSESLDITWYQLFDCKLFVNILNASATGQHVGQHVVQQIDHATYWSGLLWQLLITFWPTCVNSIQTYVVFIKKHSKFYDFDIRIVKKTFEFKFHVGQHVGFHRKPHQHVILVRFYKFVGQHFLIF